MAQAKKSTTTTKQKSASAKRPAAKKAPVKQAPPKKTCNTTARNVGGVVCLFLALCGFIGYADVDAWFISYLCGFVKGVIGGGYFLFPIALLACGLVLLLSRKRPVKLKVTCLLLAPLVFGSIYHIFGVGNSMGFDSGFITTLYDTGKETASGGVVSGMLAMGLCSAITEYAAAPILIIAFLFFTLNGVGLTVSKIVAFFRKKSANKAEKTTYVEQSAPKRKATAAEPQPVPEPEPPAHFGVFGGRRRKNAAIDIPIDDDSVSEQDYQEEKVGFFNTKPRVKTPDQVLTNAPETTEVPCIIDEAPPKQPSVPAPAALPTVDTKPLSVEEAAAIAGVSAAAVTQISSDGGAAGAVGKKLNSQEIAAETEEISKTIEKSLEDAPDEYRFPPVTLLKTGAGISAVDGRQEIDLNRERLESTVRSFGVNGSITNVTRGPTVTRYDLELEQGVKLAKLTNLAGDVALALGVVSVRIAPIPDKISTVGIEVPNKLVSTVYLRDILDSSSFKSAKSKLSFALGEDIGGSAIVGNIAKLPHMLIAGTTGSGKSVCMNCLILSLLYKATPEEVRLIMIDPKMVELGVYNGIPHLFVPVVTDPKKAAGALQWAVIEMLKRYRLFSDVGVRDLTGYNAHQKNIGEETMPRVVIVIDELADLMLVASKEVEESICRVAQMGRAAGMHLIIATQRPSADVITGLMKANIPSRIAFAVSSAMESRIILDSSGAEKLVGAGDMLYAPLGVGKPLRIQGAFVTDEERESVISFLKEGSEANYSEDILAQIEQAAAAKDAPSGGEREADSSPASQYDELLPQAVDVIFETKQASVSMLQRRLKLGYARAARIVDQMEEVGVVGPFEGSKPRQILITKQQWQEMQTIQGTAPVEDVSEQVSFSDYTDAPAEEWKE